MHSGGSRKFVYEGLKILKEPVVDNSRESITNGIQKIKFMDSIPKGNLKIYNLLVF